MTSETRPKIKLSLSSADKVQEMLAVLLLVFNALFVLYHFPGLPEKVPMHFNLSGEVDGWGKKTFLLGLPAVALFVYVLLTTINRIPDQFNYPFRLTPENAEAEYYRATRLIRFLKLSIMALFAVLSWRMVAAVQQGTMDIGPMFVWIAMAAVLLPLAWYLFKGKRQ